LLLLQTVGSGIASIPRDTSETRRSLIALHSLPTVGALRAGYARITRSTNKAHVTSIAGITLRTFCSRSQIKSVEAEVRWETSSATTVSAVSSVVARTCQAANSTIIALAVESELTLV